MASLGITGGPLLSLRWAGIEFNPSQDAETEYDLSDRDYEVLISGSGNTYTNATAKPGYVQTGVVLTADQYREVLTKKDGISRAGTATLPDGSVLSLDCAIDGEFKPTNGIATLKLTGKLKLQ